MSPPREAVLARQSSGLGLCVVTQDTKSGSTRHRVSEVHKGGPAAQAGVKKGDRVLSVNGVSIVGESHEFALAAFSLSMDGEVVLMVEADTSEIKSKDAKKPPVMLSERKSSHNLLAAHAANISPKKNAPNYEQNVAPVQKKVNYKVNKYVTVQSNPSTGFMGLAIMQFKDCIPRVGGIHPKSPCANADLRPGDIILSVDGIEVDDMKLEEVAKEITANKGKPIKLGLHVMPPEEFDFQTMLTEESERQVWFQQGEASTIGLKLGETRRGARITEFFDGGNAQFSGLAIGDVMVGVNDNDVSSSSYREILAAFVLTTSPVLTVRHDRTPITLVGGSFGPADEEALKLSTLKSNSSRRAR